MPRSQPARPPGPPYTRVALCVCVPLHPLAMVDAFLGTWKLVDTANFDEYMKALGEWGGLRGGGGWSHDIIPFFFYHPPHPPICLAKPPAHGGLAGGGCRRWGGRCCLGRVVYGGLWGFMPGGLGGVRGLSSFPCPLPGCSPRRGSGCPHRGAGSRPGPFQPPPPPQPRSSPSPSPSSCPASRQGWSPPKSGPGRVGVMPVPPHPAHPWSWWVLVQDPSPSNGSVPSPPSPVLPWSPPQARWAHIKPPRTTSGEQFWGSPPTVTGRKSSGVMPVGTRG